MLLFTRNSQKKNGKILRKYVEFCSHFKSLDGTNAPSNEELVRLGFSNVNTTLANTIEALKNAPSKSFSEVELEKMVEKVVNYGTTEMRKEMIIMKEDIGKKAKEYADVVQAQASKTIGVQLSLLKKQLVATMQCIDSVVKRLKAFALEGNMDLSN